MAPEIRAKVGSKGDNGIWDENRGKGRVEEGEESPGLRLERFILSLPSFRIRCISFVFSCFFVFDVNICPFRFNTLRYGKLFFSFFFSFSLLPFCCYIQITRMPIERLFIPFPVLICELHWLF